MRRKIVHPYGQSGTGMRVISSIAALLVLFMLYERLKDPSIWRAFADDKETRPSSKNVVDAEPEVVVPGPNDLDEEEVAKAQDDFEAVVDFKPRQFRDMAAYWRLMDWSRTQKFADLEARARDDIPFAQLFEQPERYRGKLIYLRMHLMRATSYEPEKNPEFRPGIKRVYDAWGNTDESHSFPYCVVFTDPPDNLPLGQDIRAEVVFVGYLLKVMTYKAADNQNRGAPLLVGRLRVVSVPKTVTTTKTDPWTIALVIVGGVAFIGYSVWFSMKSRTRPKIIMQPKELSLGGAADEPAFDNFYGHSSDGDGGSKRFGLDLPMTFGQPEVTSPESSVSTLPEPDKPKPTEES